MRGHNDDQRRNRPEPARKRRIVVLAYVRADCGDARAFSILVFLTNFFTFELSGAIRKALEVWTDYVRPFVGGPIQWLVDFLPQSWRFEVSVAWKDYFAVGLVTFLSFWRTLRVFGILRNVTLGEMLIVASYLISVWPVAVVFPHGAIGIALFGPEEHWRKRTQSLGFVAVWFAPLIYLGLLFAANTWLL